MIAPIVVDARMASASGIGTYIRKLLAGGVLAALQRPVVVFVSPGHEDLAVEADGPVSRIPMRAAIFSPAEQLAFRRLVPADAALLWVPHFNIPARGRQPLVVTLHDIAMLNRPGTIGDWPWRAYGRFLLRRIARRARAVVCDSQFTRHEFATFTGCDPSRLDVVRLGVGDEWFSIANSSSPHPKPYILFVGNFKPHKNVRGLLRAFGAIQGRVPHDLLLIGKTTGLRTRDRAAEALARDAGSRVTVVGHVDGEAVRRHVSHAAAVVVPSTYEGFGLQALEAMAAGRPVVAASAASLPEVCGDAVATFDPYDEDDMAAELLRVLSSRDVASDLGRRGRRRARQFTWTETVARTGNILRRALEGPRARL